MRGFILITLICMFTLVAVVPASAGDYTATPLILPGQLPDRPSLSPLDIQPDTIKYDDGNPTSLYPQRDYWCSVRFTAPASFILHEIYLVTINGIHASDPCNFYIYGPDGPISGQELALSVITGPLPDFAWSQANINPAVEFSPGEDFYVVFGPVPGGSQGTTGFKPLLDPGTTTQRSAIAFSGGRFGEYTTIVTGDWLLRAGGELSTFTDLEAVSCYNETASGESSFNVAAGEEIIAHTQIRNNGTTTVGSYLVNCFVTGPGGSLVHSQSQYMPLLAHGATTTFSTTGFVATDPGEYLVTTSVNASGDGSTANNVARLRFFAGGNHRWYLYDDNLDANSYYSFSPGAGWGLSFTPTEHPAKVSSIRVNTSGAGFGDFRIYLNDGDTGSPTGIPIWTSTPALTTGWNTIDVDPPVYLFGNASFTVAYLYQNGIDIGVDSDPPNCAENSNMPVIAWQAASDGTAWFADNSTHGNTCIQAFIDTTDAFPNYPIIETNVTELNFGEVRVGFQNTMSLWVHNRGYIDDLIVSSFSLLPPAASSYYWITPSSFSVAAHDSQLVTIDFDPGYAGSFSAVVDINNNSENSPLHRVLLQGTGIACDAHTEYVDITGSFPLCRCVEACEYTTTTVCFYPLLESQQPTGYSYDYYCSQLCGESADPDCLPALPDLTRTLYFDAELGGWCVDFEAFLTGCFCVCIDGILPVELLSFEAIPGDGQITLNWQTASETENDHFELVRDEQTVGQVAATNLPSGSGYSWTETGLTNGLRCDYDLLAVSIYGDREVIGHASATPVRAAAITEYKLSQNYPNPFNPRTEISFDLVDAGLVSLNVYNLLGQQVATLANRYFEAGQHLVAFDAGELTSGVYLYRLESNRFTATRKMILMK